MSESFFLIHLIDKNNYFGIYSALREISHGLFITGTTRYDFEGNITYIQNIEPNPRTNHFGTDSKSIWLGIGIKPKNTFVENILLYKDLCKWVMDFLYLSRFLINLNLKANVFFHIENLIEGSSDAKISIQNIIDINCDSSSNFRVQHNKYDLLIPLLSKLLEYNPTEMLRAIMYNYATSKTGHSGVVDYFFSFATLEGVIHNWAEANGYSHLWGNAIALQTEQDEINKDLRDLISQFINNRNYSGEKLNQLISFRDSSFPLERKLRRSLRQQFKSYYKLRLPINLQENENVKEFLNNFSGIYSRRNEIGHSLETYLGSPGLIKDIKVLMSTIKVIMDFELKQFLGGEIDWKFENRINNLNKNMEKMTQTTALDKFKHDIKVQEQNKISVRDRFGTRQIENAEFQSIMKKQINEDEDIPRPVLIQYLKLVSSQTLSRIRESNAEPGIIDVYKDPYWWISITHDNSHYIIKTFPPTNFKTTFEIGIKKAQCEISTENIISIVKLDHLDIPDDFDVFAFGKPID